MHMLLLALLATVTVNEVTLDTDIIENTDDQWIAPGYRIAEELVLDPGEYGNPINVNDIGFQPFFVDTPDGEKWRIILVFDGEVVVLQEDTAERRYPIAGDIRYMMNSANGRYVLLGLNDEQTHDEIAWRGYSPPEHRVVLLNTDTGEQVTTTDFKGVGFIGNNGFSISIKNDAIEFYDNELNLVGTTSNFVREIGGTATGYASDGSLLVRVHTEDYSDPESFILRAYDEFGNILWITDNEHYGFPIVSEHGEYVFVLQSQRLLCLDGNDGNLLWQHMNDNHSSSLSISHSRTGAAFSYMTNSPSTRNRSICIGWINELKHTSIEYIGYHSDQIAFFSPDQVTQNGYALLRVFFSERPNTNLSRFMYCIFDSDGSLLFERMISTEDRMYGNIWANLPRALTPAAISITGKRIILWDKKDIFVLSIAQDGVSE